MTEHRPRGVMSVRIKQRPLTMRDGKISISNSLRSCKHCQRLSNQMICMRKQIVRLNDQLQQEKTKNKEMDILCEQISRTKQRFMLKFGNIHKQSLGNKISANHSMSTVKLQNRYEPSKLNITHPVWDYF